VILSISPPIELVVISLLKVLGGTAITANTFSYAEVGGNELQL